MFRLEKRDFITGTWDSQTRKQLKNVNGFRFEQNNRTGNGS